MQYCSRVTRLSSILSYKAFGTLRIPLKGRQRQRNRKLLKAIRVRVQVAVTKRSMLLKTDRTRLKITLIIDLMNIVLAMIWCFQQVTNTNEHRLRYMRVAGKAAQVPFLSAVDRHKFIVNAPINVNPVERGGGGGGNAGNGWGFDQGIHLLSGRFDQVPLLGGRDICFVGQRDCGQDKAWLPGIVFLIFGMAWVSERVSFFTDIYLLLHRPSSLKNAVFRTFLLLSV